MKYQDLKKLVKLRLSTRQISERLGIGQTSVRYWLKKFGLETSPGTNERKPHKKSEAKKLQDLKDKFPFNEINKDRKAGLSYTELGVKYHIHAAAISAAIKYGLLEQRSKSESAVIARKKYPVVIPLKQKQKISASMKKIHSDGKHPGWSFINTDKTRRSYPEKFLLQVFRNNGIIEMFDVQEKYRFGKYFLDFAFPELKLDIEIDGSQHVRTKEAIDHDVKRDKFLISDGWKVYRISWSEMLKSPKREIRELLSYINNIENRGNRFYDIAA